MNDVPPDTAPIPDPPPAPSEVTSFDTIIVTGDIVFNTPTLQLRLGVDDAGDLIVTEVGGPNAGRAVNLTHGHWSAAPP